MEKFNYGENLRKIRMSKGISQEAIANHLKVSQRTYSRWEHRSAIPSMDIVIATAEYFKVPETELLPPGGVPEAPAKNKQSALDEKLNEFLRTPMAWILTFGASVALCEAMFQLALGTSHFFGVSLETSQIIANTAGMVTFLYIVNKILQILIFRKRASL